METCPACDGKGSVDIKINHDIEFRGVAVMPCPLCKLGMTIEKSAWQQALDFANLRDFSLIPPDRIDLVDDDDKRAYVFIKEYDRLKAQGCSEIPSIRLAQDQISAEDQRRIIAVLSDNSMMPHDYKDWHDQPEMWGERAELLRHSLQMLRERQHDLDAQYSSKHSIAEQEPSNYHQVNLRALPHDRIPIGGRRFDIKDVVLKCDFDENQNAVLYSNIEVYVSQHLATSISNYVADTVRNTVISKHLAYCICNIIMRDLHKHYALGEVRLNRHERMKDDVILFKIYHLK